jgi:Ger(x)C family germination protein
MKFRCLRVCSAIMSVLLLPGCYDSHTLKESAIVMGTGVSKIEGQKGYKVSVEILRAGMGFESAAGEGGGGLQKKSVTMHIHADNLFDAARKFIVFTKRRLFFNHNRIWVISEEVARENINRIFDPLHRDQMLRLNSYMFITKEDPEDILSTASMLESLTSVELATSIQAGKFLGANIGGVDMIAFYEMISGPIKAAFVPMIGIRQMQEHKVTELIGVAIINEDKMAGYLPGEIALGLSMLRGETKGGVIKAEGLDTDGDFAVELSSLKSKVSGTLKDGKLKATVNIRLRATVAVLPPDISALDAAVIEQLEEGVEKWVKEMAETALRKLQKEFKTDVTKIGIYMYRKHPREWRKVKDQWSEVFAGGDISVNVHADIYHPGLTGKLKGDIKPRPLKNPYRFMLAGN